MRIIIFANGWMPNPGVVATRWLQPGDIIVAADGGTRYALAAGVLPARVIGDLDSLDAALRAQLESAGTVLHSYPPAKDETDLELALLWAAEQPATTIIILGGLGGRPDQELANLLLLALPVLAGREVILADAAWAIRCIRGGETLALQGASGDTVSLIPLGGDAQGISTTGLVYPLHHETLRFGPARGVSNQLVGEQATVTLEQGLLWCMQKISQVIL